MDRHPGFFLGKAMGFAFNRPFGLMTPDRGEEMPGRGWGFLGEVFQGNEARRDIPTGVVVFGILQGRNRSVRAQWRVT